MKTRKHAQICASKFQDVLSHLFLDVLKGSVAGVW